MLPEALHQQLTREIAEVDHPREKAIDVMNDQIRGVHGSIISSAIIGTVKVPHRGQQTPINHIANAIDTTQV